MDFWLISVAIAGLVAVSLAWAALARRDGSAGAGTDVQVYRDQLSDVDRDFTRGVLNKDEAGRLRLEVSRRLLEADLINQNKQSQNAAPSPILALILVLAVSGGAFGLYLQLGSIGTRDLPLQTRIAMAEDTRLNRITQSEAESRLPPPDTNVADPAHLDLMQKLRTALETRPDDLQGHILLAGNEAGLGNFGAAHKAQRRVLDLKGDDAVANDFANYADLLALAANGYISPQAESAILQTLTMDPNNGSGRYYLGLMQAQIGRPDLALSIWSKLLQDSLPNAPWVPPIRAQIEFTAAEAGVRYELAPLAPGPDAEAVSAAQDMSAQDRDAMIRGMVEQLSARLADEGGSAQEWARLIGALGVLGDTERARAIWGEAQNVFAAAPQDLAAIRRAAIQAGIAQ